MLKQLWQLGIIRIASGLFLIIIGILVGLIPGPGGLILLLPGFIILIREMPFLRHPAASIIRFIRKYRRLRVFMRKTRIVIYKKTGWRLFFKKGGNKNDR